jgi:putative nucleotidyltransferase with HDIG domain
VTRPLSLATRTFLVTFSAICAVLVAGFYTLNAGLKARIKDSLKQNLTLTEAELDRQQADYDQHSAELISTLSQNPSLKAAIGLAREQTAPALQAQVRATIEDQLRELSKGLDFNLFLVTNPDGDVIASIGAPMDEAQLRRASSQSPAGPWLIPSGKNLYRVRSVPINLGDENLGRLAVGRRFVLTAPGENGYAALIGPSGIIQSTLPSGTDEEMQRQLSKNCSGKQDGCEIRAGGQSYFALGMSQDASSEYKILHLASIDDAMRGFAHGLKGVFLLTGLGGVLLAALFAWVATRSISRPLARLATELESSGETGALWRDFSADSSTQEVNLLATALNRAAKARRQVETELRVARDTAEAATNRVALTYDDTLQALGAALDLRDNETAGHSNRVTRYCLELARRMGCAGDQLKNIERGAYLHDIGKIGTPDAILLKPGKLNEPERAVMQQHAQVGYELVSKIEFLQEAAEIVYCHQERFDGSGYPRGLAGDAIPLGARIFAVADTFDAMTSNRPYRAALTLGAAIDEIRRESGRQFDPRVVEVLCSIPPSVWDEIRHEVSGLGGSVASRRADLKTSVLWKREMGLMRSVSVNISESGMLLETPGPLVLGEELALEFTLPGARTCLKPRVQVVRKEARGIGVRFVTLTVEARQSIREYTSPKVQQAEAVAS